MNYKSTKEISAESCPSNPALLKSNFVPLGASVWTSSGDLANHGITAIAQAASGAMRNGQGFDPTRDSVAASIKNSLLLAAGQGYKNLAVPFIASGIFKNRIKPAATKSEIAFIITQAAVNFRGNVGVVIVAWNTADKALFDKYVHDANDPGITVKQGSITDFNCHNCAAIMNAANMEVQFGGGISGRIANAVNKGSGGGTQANAIDVEAQEYLKTFWAANPAS